MNKPTHQFSLNGGTANRQTPDSKSILSGTQCRTSLVVVLAGLITGALLVPVRAATVAVDFRQDLDPARVSVGLGANFQQARTAGEHLVLEHVGD